MCPIYSYACDYCGKKFDALVYPSEDDTGEFKECECESVAKRTMTSPAAARGGFGTPRRNASRDHIQQFDFAKKKEEPKSKDEQPEFDWERGTD